MSIQEITPYTPHAEVKDCPKEPAFHPVETDINFLGDWFKASMAYPGDFKGKQKPTPTKIHYYSDIGELTKKYNFSENGFEYYKLEEGSPLASAIEQNAKCLHTELLSTEEESKLFSQVEQFLSSWGKINKILGTPVIVNSVYRSSDPDSSRMKPFLLAHVDFSKEDITDPLSDIGKMYKVGAEKVFGKMSNENYRKSTHYAQVTMWVSLHDGSPNMLAVMNTASDENLPDKLRPVSLASGLIFSLHPNERQEWVAANLTLKDRTVILFDTVRTPHTAINIEGMPKSTRTSLEIRATFMSPPE